MRKEFVRKALGYVLAIVFILAGWELTALAVNNAALPGPFEAVPMVGLYFGDLWPAFLVSLYRVVVAMLLNRHGSCYPSGLGLRPFAARGRGVCAHSVFPLSASEGRAASCPGSPYGPRRRPEDCAYRLDHRLPGLGYGARCGAKRARGKRRLHAVAWGREVRRVSPRLLFRPRFRNSLRLCVSRVEPRSPSCFSRKASPVPRDLGTSSSTHGRCLRIRRCLQALLPWRCSG